MSNIIDYVNGQLIDPTSGRSVKRITTGFTPTDAAVGQAPIASGADAYYAPNFFSNLNQDTEYYDAPDAGAGAGDSGTAYRGSGNLALPGQTDRGGEGAQGALDARTDINRQAGVISDFGDWVDAAMTGTSMIGKGGPLIGLAGQATGQLDFTDSFNNYSTTPEWAGTYDKYIKQGMDPNAAAMAAMQELQAAGVQPAARPSSVAETQGTSQPVERVSSSDPDAARVLDSSTPLGNTQGATIERVGKTDAYGVPDNSYQGDSGVTIERAGGSAGGSDSGGNRLGASGGVNDRFGGNFAKGGFITQADYKVPKSAMRPSTQHRIGTPQKFAQGGMVQNQIKQNSQTNGYVSGGFVPNAGFAEGGMVPRQGFDDGGAISQQARVNPAPSQVKSDGVTDNQPIMADEGEFVIRRDSAQVLGPEVLNALNDPQLAAAFRQLFDEFSSIDDAAEAEPTVAPSRTPPSSMPTAGPAPDMMQGNGRPPASKAKLSALR